MEFFVSINDRKEGPFSPYEISEKLQTGEIDGNSLVWSKGMSGWEKLREVPALQSSRMMDRSENSDEEEGFDGSKQGMVEEATGLDPGADGENSPRTRLKNRTIPVAAEVRPLNRFWARTFDYLLMTVMVVFLFSDVAPPPLPNDPDITFGELMTRITKEVQSEEWRLFASLIFYSQIVWAVIEGFLLHFFGTTPGKALFGIRVRTESGGHPSLLVGITRALYVYFAGVAMYFLPFSILTMTMGFFRLLLYKKTLWDKHLKLEVEHPPLGFVRILLAIWAFLALVIVQNLAFR